MRRFWRCWDAVLYVGALFLMSTQLVHEVNPHDVDGMLIGWDRAIRGIELLQWTQTWSAPLLDEIAKIAWVCYFFLPLVPGIVLYRKKNLDSFQEAKLILVLAWLVTFGCYYALPAKGPLHFQEELKLVEPSDGVAVGKTLKTAIADMEGGEARDTFPSGHAMIAALSIFLCFHNRLWKTLVLVAPIGLGIIFATVYLRYHYVVDVVVGLALCVPIAWLSVKWQWRRLDNEINTSL
ncbi:MAG: phosphatase PAP2 family protein [Planctomycetota bacterium]